MTKKKTVASSATNELDALLEGINVESTPVAVKAKPRSITDFEGLGEPEPDEEAVSDSDDKDSAVISINDALEAEPEDAETVEAAPVEIKETKKRGKKVVGATEKVARVSVAGMSKSEVARIRCNAEDLAKIGIDATAMNAMLAKIDTLPIKVREKSVNLLKFMSGGDTLSNYSRYALEYLAKEPQTVPQIVNKMIDRGYAAGTARSQAQQISRLFLAYDMVSKDGGMLKLNTESPLTKHAMDRLHIAA